MCNSMFPGHHVVQLRMIFCLIWRDRPANGPDEFLAYMQKFNVVRYDSSAGMYLLVCAISQADGYREGYVIPISHIHSHAHLIPHFSEKVYTCIQMQSVMEAYEQFWLNKCGDDGFFSALSEST